MFPFIYYLVEYGIALGLFIVCLSIFSVVNLISYTRATDFVSHLQSLSINEWRNKYLDRVVEKINVTNSMVEKKLVAEDVVAKCIYNYDVVKQLGAELEVLFFSQYKKILEKYPAITNLDLLVLTLLAVEMSNAEICSVLRMERRTLYRRRQLIGQRLGVSSEALEQMATQLLLADL